MNIFFVCQGQSFRSNLRAQPTPIWHTWRFHVWPCQNAIPASPTVCLLLQNGVSALHRPSSVDRKYTDQDTITNLPSNSGPLLNFWGGDRPFSEHSLPRIHKAFRREQERTTQLRVQQTTKYTHPTAVQCRCVVWCPHAHSQSHAMVTG